MSFGRHRHSSSLWRIVPITLGGALIAASAVLAVTGHDVLFLRLATALSLAVAVFSLLMFSGRERDFERERDLNERERDQLTDALADVRATAEEQRRTANERAAMVEGQRAALAIHSRRIAELEALARTAEATSERFARERDDAVRQVGALRVEFARATDDHENEAPPAVGALPPRARFARAAEVLASLAQLRSQQAEGRRNGDELPTAGPPRTQPPKLTAETSVRSTYAPVPIGPTAVVPAIAAQLEAVARRSGTFPGFVDPRTAPPASTRPTKPAAPSAEPDELDLTPHDETQQMNLADVRVVRRRRA